MAFVTATTAKSQSDAAALQANPVVGTLTETIINDAINAESNRTDTFIRNYAVRVTLNADINGGTKPIEIIQSDSSRINLADLVVALEAAGYRAAVNPIKTNNNGDIVKLYIAWNE